MICQCPTKITFAFSRWKKYKILPVSSYFYSVLYIHKQREGVIGSYGYKAPIGYNLDAYQGANHVSHAPSESDVYGFAERREAEGSEDFDAFVDQSYAENNRLSTTLPNSNERVSPPKEVRFDVFSEPTSPYSTRPYHNHQVQYNRHKNQRLSTTVSTYLSTCVFGAVVDARVKI